MKVAVPLEAQSPPCSNQTLVSFFSSEKYSLYHDVPFTYVVVNIPFSENFAIVSSRLLLIYSISASISSLIEVSVLFILAILEFTPA